MFLFTYYNGHGLILDQRLVREPEQAFFTY